MLGVKDKNRVIADKYSKLLEKHGTSHRSIDWGSRESQYLRFKILCEIGDLQGKRILDVGCGLCDFYQYLIEQDIDVEYYGIDITQKMVDKARERFGDLHIELRDIVKQPLAEKYDYVFSSGIFYLLPEESHVEELISTMHHVANIGLAFNSLSSWGPHKEKAELYLNPYETIKYCHQHLSNRVVLRHDYMPHDFTVYLYKPIV